MNAPHDPRPAPVQPPAIGPGERPSLPPTASKATSVSAPTADTITRHFVEHWGVMARSWGINATMGELFALLYITGDDWTADALREWLQVSRGNVSMNLRELMAWGVVHKVHRAGERREYYRAETDVWTLFRRILTERKRRELDPTLVVLARTAEHIENDPALHGLRERIVALQEFFSLIDALAGRLATLEPADIDMLRRMLVAERDGAAE